MLEANLRPTGQEDGDARISHGFGLHLTLDLEDCDELLLQDLRLTHDVLQSLASQLGMTALTPPTAFHYDGGASPRDEGITGFIVIAQSHISIHTFPHKRFAFADVFSCRTFDTAAATRLLALAYRSTVHTAHIVERGRNFPWG